MMTDATIATILEPILARVQEMNDAPCIVCGAQVTSYGKMWDNARRVEAYLRFHGVSDGDRVALIADNSLEYVAVFYGALLAGAAVVPMNTSAKMRDYSNWLLHSQTKVAFVNFVPRQTHDLLCSGDEQVALVSTNTAADLSLHAGTANPPSGTWDDVMACPVPSNEPGVYRGRDSLACIIYTSGTTGSPKGVMISHSNLKANVQSILAALPIETADRFLNVLPFYYSYGNSVLHTHLVKGATIFLENSMMYPNQIVSAMAKERITGFAGVPSTFSLLLSRGRLGEHDLSALRYILQAGGAMPVPIIEQVLAQMNPHLYIMYGQTEATARLACLQPQRLLEKLGSVGVPVDGVNIEIRNPRGLPCQAMETGELFVRGENVALGYWRNPEATKATFVDGWLKTGDLGHKDADGFIYLTGRRSDMIKSGANRISPLEIEEVLVELPEVEEAAAVGIPDELLGQTIAAFLVLKTGHTLDIRAVKKHCLDNLASYKIPKQIIVVDALPKTASGKVKNYLLVKQAEEKR